MILLAILSAIFGVRDEIDINSRKKKNEIESQKRIAEFERNMSELRKLREKKYH